MFSPSSLLFWNITLRHRPRLVTCNRPAVSIFHSSVRRFPSNPRNSLASFILRHLFFDAVQGTWKKLWSTCALSALWLRSRFCWTRTPSNSWTNANALVQKFSQKVSGRPNMLWLLVSLVIELGKLALAFSFYSTLYLERVRACHFIL